MSAKALARMAKSSGKRGAIKDHFSQASKTTWEFPGTKIAWPAREPQGDPSPESGLLQALPS